MTHDEIIEMAKEAGFPDVYTEWAKSDWSSIKGLIVPMTLEQLERCAKLVAAKEREACAKIVQTHLDANDDLRTKGSLASVLDYIKFRGEA
jgi:predicted transcriptional regulator